MLKFINLAGIRTLDLLNMSLHPLLLTHNEKSITRIHRKINF